ncbi:MAG TPA: hypothetical protein VFR09_00855 [Alphaproteobacteria bacterium]|nr:hypothetical protein [Alphaproteobacteria bacterium]
MHSIPLILSAILTLALVMFIAPNIFAMNRGKVLRNIAIWLALFAGLGLVYQYVGPNSPHPLFGQPEAFQQMKPMMTPGLPDQPKPADDTKRDDAHDYAPPNGD